MGRGLALLLALLLFTAGAAAQEGSPPPGPAPSLSEAQAPDAAEREARQRYAEELAVCAAFYLVASEAARRQESSTWARIYTRLAGILLDRAAEAGDEALVTDRAKTAVREMFDGLDRKMSEFPALWKVHSETCATAYDHPERLLEKWRVAVRER